VSALLIKNRPITHYLLSIFSLFLEGKREISLKSYGSLNGKNADIIHLISEVIIPHAFEVKFQNGIERVSSIDGKVKASSLTATLQLAGEKAEQLSRQVQLGKGKSSELPSKLDICELELLCSLLRRNDIFKIQLATVVRGEELSIAEIDLKEGALSINTKFPEGKGDESIELQRPKLVDALARAGVLKPDLERHRKIIAQWDDIILGLDTNLFYSCALTSFVLDAFLKIPSGDFIDSPDWVTLVLSKIAMSEIESHANYSKDPHSLYRRLALRAIQEIMTIHRSKDLEGVSMFLTGLVPPEIDFTSRDTMIVRDSLIRNQFRDFLKGLDFYKGSYFLTSDFNSATLAEAEGLVPLYIRMPHLHQGGYRHKLFVAGDKVNLSELIYELSVTFLPLVVKAEDIVLTIRTIWKDKNLEDWENWKLEVEWEKDTLGIRTQLEHWLNAEITQTMVQGWRNLKERYVSWVK